MARAIFSIVLILAAVGVSIVWTRPLWQEARLTAADKAEFQSTLLRFQELRKTRDELLNKYNSLSKDDLLRLESLMPSRPDSGFLLTTLEALSKKNGVLLKRIDIREQAEKAAALNQAALPFELLPFEITISGSYESFRSFLGDLERSRRLVEVKEVSFTAGGANSYEVAIKAATFWQKR